MREPTNCRRYPAFTFIQFSGLITDPVGTNINLLYASEPHQSSFSHLEDSPRAPQVIGKGARPLVGGQQPRHVDLRIEADVVVVVDFVEDLANL